MSKMKKFKYGQKVVITLDEILARRQCASDWIDELLDHLGKVATVTDDSGLFPGWTGVVPDGAPFEMFYANACLELPNLLDELIDEAAEAPDGVCLACGSDDIHRHQDGIACSYCGAHMSLQGSSSSDNT